jgi:uncharacterized protein
MSASNQIYTGLSLDGGGLFGIGQAAILEKCTCLSKFDFLIGTSVGALNAANISIGKTNNMVNQFKIFGNRIFKDYWYRRYNIFTPRYTDKELNNMLKSLFPGKFGDVKVPLFITAANFNECKLKVFFSLDKDDKDWPLWEVIRAAVAAETYFLPWKDYGDGGIYANNPSTIGIIGVLDSFFVDINNIRIFSIGTGTDKDPYFDSTKYWTIFRWGVKLIEIMLKGGSCSMHEKIASTLLKDKNYKRIQFLDRCGSFDNPKVMDIALKEWSQTINDGIKAINSF